MTGGIKMSERGIKTPFTYSLLDEVI